jgi:hypothetical protein
MDKPREDPIDALIGDGIDSIYGAMREVAHLFLAIQKLHGTETACAIFNRWATPDTPAWRKRCRDERYLNQLGYRTYHISALKQPPEPEPVKTVYALAREIAAETGKDVASVERYLYRLVAGRKAAQAATLADWYDDPDDPDDP